MKGKKKYIVPLLLAGVTTATGVVTTVNQAVTVEAASATYTNDTKVEGVEIKLVEGFEDKYQIGDTVTIQAEVVGASGANLEYKVTKNGKNVPVEVDDEGATPTYYGSFKVDFAGYYNISVSAKVGDMVVSTIDDLSIWVEKAEATINLAKHSYYVVPAKVPTSQENLKIPAPTVTRDNAEGKEETIKVRDITGDSESVSVKLITPSNSEGTALEFVRDDNIPPYLKDNTFGDSETKSKSLDYKYPHNYGGYVEQQYLPDSLKDKKYYVPKDNGFERQVKKIRLSKGMPEE